MKTLFLFLTLIAASTCTQAQQKLSDLAWLTGTWQRTNVKPGRTAVEVWKKATAGEMIGKGASLQGADTVFVEKLKIILKDGTLYYVADVPENKEPVLFKFTELTSTSFVCENPTHDFPKKIAYKLEGNKLTATISAGEKKMDFLFVKK